MKNKVRIVTTLLIIAATALLGGCVTQINADVTPGAKLSEAKKFYVVHLAKDERGVERLIADQLNKMGKSATAGEKSAMPADVDMAVTYQDHWQWDMTMYMISLDVQLRDPKTDMALATGHSLRTSLARKSPPEMVADVLSEIFKKK